MSGLELNKIAAAILVAGIIAMITGLVTEGLYEPETKLEKRGYSIEVAEDTGTGAAQEEIKVDILSLIAVADPVKGEASSKKCVSCHSFDNGGPNKVGPNLYGIVGAGHAHRGDYEYSSAMAALKGKKWDYNELSEFLTNPKKHVPGTKMSFAGIKDPGERAALIAYLRSLSPSPVALPQAAPAAPVAEPAAAATEPAAEAAPAQ